MVSPTSALAKTFAERDENKLLNPLGSVILHSKKGERGGSGCPISPNLLLTAAHVWENTLQFGDLSIVGETFSGLKIIPTTLKWRAPDKAADIALLEIPEEGVNFQKWFPLKKKTPSLGERLKMPLSNPMVRYGLLYGNFAWEEDGDFFIDMAGFPGISGSCILNEKDELIAIVSGVYGNWTEVPMRSFIRAVPVKEVK